MARRLRALVTTDGEGGARRAAAELGLRWEVARSPDAFLRGLPPVEDAYALVSFGVEGVDVAFVERVARAMRSADRLLVSAPGASLELAVAARNLGTGALLREPVEEEDLRDELRRRSPVEDRLEFHSGQVPTDESEASTGSPGIGLVGSSSVMARIVRSIAEVADTKAPVLVTGESGTGKELVARAIHWAGPRGEGPFVPINCAAIPEHLLESEFFGHERGAFTGAVARKRGRFERAHGGTLFLDEVGDMSFLLQAKLLRALEEGEIERVGGEAPLRVDVRVVAASNRPLEELVERGDFREDLFFRLAGVRLHIPPLRDRLDDLDELVVHFARESARAYQRRLRGIDRAALRLLRTHPWPGNVRELRNVVDRGVRRCRGEWIRPEDVAPVGEPAGLAARERRPSAGYPATASLADVERDHIARVLEFTGGAMGEAAEILGIHRNTLTRKVAHYGIGREEEEG